LTDDDSGAAGEVAFYVKRTTAAGGDSGLALDARAFGAEIQRLVADMREVTVTEFQVTSIEAGQASQQTSQPSQTSKASQALQLVRTDVRFDIVGVGTTAWRVERNGVWRMSWRKGAAGGAAARGSGACPTPSRAPGPAFTR